MIELNEQLEIEREKINELNHELILILDKRLEIVKNIAKIKQKNNIPIFQAAREKEILESFSSKSKNPEFTIEIFKKIMQQSRKFQERLICQNK